MFYTFKGISGVWKARTGKKEATMTKLKSALSMS